MARQMENAHAKQMLDFVTNTSLFVEDFCKHDPNQTGKLCKIMREQETFTTHDPNNVLHQEHVDEKFFNMDNSTFVFEEMDNSEEDIVFVKNYSPIFDIMWLLATINDDKAEKLIKSLDSTRSDFLICFKKEYREGGGRPNYLLPQTILRLWRDFAKEAKVSETGDKIAVNMSTNKNDFDKTEQKKYLAFLSLFEVSDGSRQFRFIFENNGNNIFNKGIHDIQGETAGSIETSQFRKFLQHSESTALQVLRDVSNMFGINMCVFSKVIPDNTMADECKPYFTNQYANTCFMLRFQNYGKRRQVHASDDGYASWLGRIARQGIRNGAEWVINKLFGTLELRLVFALKTKRFVRDFDAEAQARREAEARAQLEAEERAKRDAEKQAKRDAKNKIKTLQTASERLEKELAQTKTTLQVTNLEKTKIQQTLNKALADFDTTSTTNMEEIKRLKSQLKQKDNKTKNLESQINTLQEQRDQNRTQQTDAADLLKVGLSAFAMGTAIGMISQSPTQHKTSTSPTTLKERNDDDSSSNSILSVDDDDTPESKPKSTQVDEEPKQEQQRTGSDSTTPTVYADSIMPTTPMCKEDGSKFTTKESLTKTIKSLHKRFKDSKYRDLDALSECCCVMIHKQEFTLANIQLPETTFQAMLKANPTMDWIMGLRGLAMSTAFGVIMTNLKRFENAIDIVNKNGGFWNLHPGFAMFQDKIEDDAYYPIYKKIIERVPMSLSLYDASSQSKIEQIIRSVPFPLNKLDEYEQKSIYYSILPQFPQMTIEEFNKNTTYSNEWPLTYSAFLHVGGDECMQTIKDMIVTPNKDKENPYKGTLKFKFQCNRVPDQNSPLGYKLTGFTIPK